MRMDPGQTMQLTGRTWAYYEGDDPIPEDVSDWSFFVGDPVEDRDKLVAIVLAEMEEIRREWPSGEFWSRGFKRRLDVALKRIEIVADDIRRYGGLAGEPDWCPECHARGTHLGSCSRSRMRSGPEPA